VTKVDPRREFEVQSVSLRDFLQSEQALHEIDLSEENHVVHHKTEKWHQLMHIPNFGSLLDETENLVNGAVFKVPLKSRVRPILEF
jgi:hypothetical protein